MPRTGLPQHRATSSVALPPPPPHSPLPQEGPQAAGGVPGPAVPALASGYGAEDAVSSRAPGAAVPVGLCFPP